MFKKIYFSVKTMYYFLLCTVLHPLLCCVPLSSQTGEYHWGLALFRHSSAAPTSLELMEWLLSFALKILQHRFRIVNAFGRSEKKTSSLCLLVSIMCHGRSWVLCSVWLNLLLQRLLTVASLSLRGRMLHSLLSQSSWVLLFSWNLTHLCFVVSLHSHSGLRCVWMTSVQIRCILRRLDKRLAPDLRSPYSLFMLNRVCFWLKCRSVCMEINTIYNSIFIEKTIMILASTPANK